MSKGAVCAVLVLGALNAAGFHGMDIARAQTASKLVAFDFGGIAACSGILAADDGGSIWMKCGGSTRIVGQVPGRPVALRVTSYNVFVGLENGDIYKAYSYQTDQLTFAYDGNVFDRPTGVSQTTWGQVKDRYRK